MKTRESNFELLRIISMLFIVLWHVIMFGNMIYNCQNEGLKICLNILQFIIVVHVNSFVLVSGYFQSKSKFKLNKFLSLVLQVIFYSIIIYLIAIKIGWVKDYSGGSILGKFTINSVGNYWFINTYLIVYLFSDYINKFINSLTKKELERFLIIGFIIFSIVPVISCGKLFYNTGYNFYHFIYMYILGAYLRLFPLNKSYYFKNLSANKYRILLVCLFFICVYLNYSFVLFSSKLKGLNFLLDYVANVFSYNSLNYSFPLIIVQSVVYFELFGTLHLKNRFVNYISKYVFGVYLIHENNIVRSNIYKVLGMNKYFYNYKMILYMFLITLFIFVVCVFIDIFRNKIFKVLSRIVLKVKKGSLG